MKKIEKEERKKTRKREEKVLRRNWLRLTASLLFVDVADVDVDVLALFLIKQKRLIIIIIITGDIFPPDSVAIKHFFHVFLSVRFFFSCYF